MRAPLAIGIDLGATKLVGGLVDAGGSVLATRRWPDRVGAYEAAVDAIVAIVTQLQRDADGVGGDPQAVGIGVAAFLDSERAGILHAANLGWRERALRADLQARLDLSVALVNDADAAAWGEHVHGAGTAESSLVLITVGTGIGGGVVLGGQLVTGANGLGGELGHLPLVVDGRPCPCGGHGCLEQYASGTRLRQSAQEGARARPDDARRMLALAGEDVEAIDGPHIVAAALEGDGVALAAFADVGRWLGLGVAHVVSLLDPAVALLGGGLAAAAGELLLAPARSARADRVGIPSLRSSLPLQMAHLGDDAGMVGAAALARR